MNSNDNKGRACALQIVYLSRTVHGTTHSVKSFLVEAVLQVMKDDKRVENEYGQSVYRLQETVGLVDV